MFITKEQGSFVCGTEFAKKSNHRANIVRIDVILSHKNADNLELVLIGGYQAVVRKGDFKIGDLAVYIQPDSVVPQTEPFRFIWEPYLTSPNMCQHPSGSVVHKHMDDGSTNEICLRCHSSLENGMTSLGEKKRRITVRKFRGEWSEGLLLPIKDFADFYNPKCDSWFWNEGDDVSDLLGITHYDPDAGTEGTQEKKIHAPIRHKRPTTVKGWFFYLLHKLLPRKGASCPSETVSFHLPEYDVESFKNYKGAFTEDDLVLVTEKIHGSNARFVCIDGTMYAGSRKLWKSPDSNCVWRKALSLNPWIEEWCREHEGFALYGEVTPTQGAFDYGCKKGQVRFFLFDILDDQGRWVPWDQWDSLVITPYRWEIDTVPFLYFGLFNEEKIKALVDGPSHVRGAKHLREGIVVKSDTERHVRGLGRLQLKLVSNAFLDKDSNAA